MADARHPILLCLSGGTGAGKTTLARFLLEVLGDQSVLVSQDWYYHDASHLPDAMRAALNFDHPDALDNELLATHLRLLRKGEAIEAPQYDYVCHSRAAHFVTIAPAPVIIVEGLHLLSAENLRNLWDLAVYIDAPDALRLSRRIARDVRERGRTRESVLSQYLDHAEPMYAHYIHPAREHAHLVLDGVAAPEEHQRAILNALKEEFGFDL